jgi:hypothetical protein
MSSGSTQRPSDSAIMAVLLVVIGVKLIGDAIAGLS